MKNRNSWRPGRRLLCLGVFWLAAACAGRAQSLSWSNPSGSVTVFGSGEKATFLQTRSVLGSADVSDFLYYLDATSSPAISRSDAMVDDTSFSSVAELSVAESQINGLPFTSGSIDFSSVNGAAGTGSGSITLYFLINVPGPATIDLSGIRSSVTGGSFSLNLFESDSAGGRFGNALLSYSGDYFDASGSYQSSAPYYVLEMNVSATAGPVSAGSAEFSYLLNLAPAAAVPEPGSTALLGVALAAGMLLRKARRGGATKRV